MRTRVKICGITDKQDAFDACFLGADAVGCVSVEQSKRYVDKKKAREIFESLPVYVSRNLVVFIDSFEGAREYAKTGCDTMQIHGEVSLEVLRKMRREFPSVSLVKSVPVDDSSISKTVGFSSYVHAFHLDSVDESGLGGSGKTHDWGLSASMACALEKPVVLGGGLSPENVSEAIARVNPYAVDVCSGVEKTYGKKDREKIESFIKEVGR